MTGGAGLRRRRPRPAAGRRRRARDRARRPVHRPGRDDPDRRRVRPGLGHRRGARRRARGGELASSSTWRPGTSSPRRRTRATTSRPTSAGTLNVLMAAREARVDRVVYTSSTSVYGNPRIDPDQRGRRHRAAVALRGEQARRRELLPRVLRELRPADRDASATRTSSARASARTTRTAASSPSSSPRPTPGEPLSIHGDGEQTRDFTYIDDAVEATLLAAIHPRAEGEVFNVGTGIETSVNELAAGDRRGARPPRSTSSHIDRRDIDNIRRRVVNIEKARRMLRWAPQVTLRARPRCRRPSGSSRPEFADEEAQAPTR